MSAAHASRDEQRRDRAIRRLRQRAHGRRSAPDCARVAGDAPADGWLALVARGAPHHIVVLVAALVFPFVATPFPDLPGRRAVARARLIALSLTFLGGYGGMISLAQMTVAGIAGYALAVLGHQQRGRDQPAAGLVGRAAARGALSCVAPR
jgi:hypothetical protein